MIPPVAQAPREPGLQGVLEPGLDPEDQVVEVDEDGFLVTAGHGWRLSNDPDEWILWSGAAVVAVAAFQTLAALVAGALQGWSATPSAPVPLPAGYYPLVLLGGVLLLVIGRRAGAGARRASWVRALACIAAGTGGALLVAELVGNVAAIVDPPATVAGGLAAAVAGNAISAVGGMAGALVAGVAAALGVMVYRWSRADGERAPEGDPIVAPARVQRAMGAITLGMAAAVACLVAFHVGMAGQPGGEQNPPAPVSNPTPTANVLLPVLIPESGVSGQVGSGEVSILPSGCSVVESGVGLIVSCPSSSVSPDATATPDATSTPGPPT